MVFSIAFVPRDTDIPMPPWAADLAGARRGRHESDPPGIHARARRHRRRVTDGTVTGGTTAPGDTVTGEPPVPTTTAAAAPTAITVTATSTP